MRQIVVTKKEIEDWLKKEADKAYEEWGNLARVAMAINNKPLTPKKAKECNPKLYYYSVLRQMVREHGAKRYIFPW